MNLHYRDLYYSTEREGRNLHYFRGTRHPADPPTTCTSGSGSGSQPASSCRSRRSAWFPIPSGNRSHLRAKAGRPATRSIRPSVRDSSWQPRCRWPSTPPPSPTAARSTGRACSTRSSTTNGKTIRSFEPEVKRSDQIQRGASAARSRRNVAGGQIAAGTAHQGPDHPSLGRLSANGCCPILPARTPS